MCFTVSIVSKIIPSYAISYRLCIFPYNRHYLGWIWLNLLLFIYPETFFFASPVPCHILYVQQIQHFPLLYHLELVLDSYLIQYTLSAWHVLASRVQYKSNLYSLKMSIFCFKVTLEIRFNSLKKVYTRIYNNNCTHVLHVPLGVGSNKRMLLITRVLFMRMWGAAADGSIPCLLSEWQAGLFCGFTSPYFMWVTPLILFSPMSPHQPFELLLLMLDIYPSTLISYLE